MFTAEERANALPNGFSGSFKQILKQKIVRNENEKGKGNLDFLSCKNG